MKLSEALALRADTQKRIMQLRERLRASALVQEGESPPEDPQDLLAELDRLLGQLRDLVGRINRSNLAARLPNGTSLTDALAARDTLALRAGILEALTEAATNRVNRYSRTEIRMVPTVDVGAVRRQADAAARERRELDTVIQGVNWSTELLE
ncbi:MAG TPA: DIP1984 family protein [Chloroflexota bacterium]|nr:DIP1984 family protein [Chloroflexota bacterium]